MAILFAFLTLISFGLTDFTAGLYTRKSDSWSAIFLNEIFGVAIISIVAILYPSLWGEIFTLSSRELLILIVASSLNFLAIASLIHGMSIGHIGLVSGIGSTFSIIVALFSFFFLNEGLTYVGWVFLAVCLVGIILACYEKDSKSKMAAGAIWGVICMLLWGVAIFLMIYISREISVFSLMFSNFIVGMIIASVIYVILFKRTKVSSGNIYLIILSVIFEALAYFTLYKASVLGNASVVGAISGSYALVPVALSYLVMKEALSRQQLVGVLSILVGLIGISIYG